MNRPGSTIPTSKRLSHLAVWPACYTLGVYVMVVLMLGLPTPDLATVVFVLLVGHGCYLLDRVKISDARQDPADALALPDRALLYTHRSRLIRAWLSIELLLSVVAGYLISPLIALIPLGALLGVHIYAGRGATPGEPRFKDLPALKSFFISSAHLALVVAVLWGNDHNLIEQPRAGVVLGLVALWLLVSADAILCDLDDRHSDAFYGTRSLPVLIGDGSAWILAQLMLMAGVVLMMVRHQEPYLMLGVGLALWISTLPTLRMNNRRDPVDARLLPIVLIALLLR